MYKRAHKECLGSPEGYVRAAMTPPVSDREYHNWSVVLQAIEQDWEETTGGDELCNDVITEGNIGL